MLLHMILILVTVLGAPSTNEFRIEYDRLRYVIILGGSSILFLVFLLGLCDCECYSCMHTNAPEQSRAGDSDESKQSAITTERSLTVDDFLEHVPTAGTVQQCSRLKSGCFVIILYGTGAEKSKEGFVWAVARKLGYGVAHAILQERAMDSQESEAAIKFTIVEQPSRVPQSSGCPFVIYWEQKSFSEAQSRSLKSFVYHLLSSAHPKRLGGAVVIFKLDLMALRTPSCATSAVGMMRAFSSHATVADEFTKQPILGTLPSLASLLCGFRPDDLKASADHKSSYNPLEQNFKSNFDALADTLEALLKPLPDVKPPPAAVLAIAGKASDGATLLKKQSDDLKRINECFTNNGQAFAWFVDGPCVTCESALKNIRTFFEHYVERDQHKFAFLYYTGHGKSGSGDWEFEDGHVKLDQILGVWEQVKIDASMVIIPDCCYAGRWTKLDNVDLKQARRSVAVFAACCPDQEAFSHLGTGSLFTFQLWRCNKTDGSSPWPLKDPFPHQLQLPVYHSQFKLDHEDISQVSVAGIRFNWTETKGEMHSSRRISWATGKPLVDGVPADGKTGFMQYWFEEKNNSPHASASSSSQAINYKIATKPNSPLLKPNSGGRTAGPRGSKRNEKDGQSNIEGSRLSGNIPLRPTNNSQNVVVSIGPSTKLVTVAGGAL